MAGSVGSRIVDPELRSTFRLKLDLVMSERPLPGYSGAAVLIDAARSLVRIAGDDGDG